MHRHVGNELLYMIEGSISDESGTIAAGSIGYRPDGCIHSVTSKNGATALAIITGGVEAAKAIGAAPPLQTIVLSEILWTDGEHKMVDHNAKEWVHGDVPTNSIESVWSLFKRSVIGSYHQLSEKHLPAYLDEFS
jgi:hypothetical protein